MTTTVLIIINVFASVAIIVLALMQQSKGDMGSAFGGGGSQSMFGSRGSANFLSRLTSIMCAAFFISSLSLAYMYAKRAESSSVVEGASVIEQVQEIDNEVPTIATPQVETDSEVPTVGASESEVPTLEAAADAVESVVDEAVDEAVEAVDDVKSD